MSAVSKESKAHVHMWIVRSMSQLRDCWILEGRRKLGLRAAGSGWRGQLGSSIGCLGHQGGNMIEKRLAQDDFWWPEEAA